MGITVPPSQGDLKLGSLQTAGHTAGVGYDYYCSKPPADFLPIEIWTRQAEAALEHSFPYHLSLYSVFLTERPPPFLLRKKKSVFNFDTGR